MEAARESRCRSAASAGLVAMMPSWLAMMIEKDEFDLSPPAGTKSQFSRELKTGRSLVDEAEKGFSGARKALQGHRPRALDEAVAAEVRRQGGAGAAPSRDAARLVMHLSHHRGQLTVYLRMNDEKVQRSTDLG